MDVKRNASLKSEYIMSEWGEGARICTDIQSKQNTKADSEICQTHVTPKITYTTLGIT